MLQQFAGAQQVEPEPQHPLKSPQQTGASSGQHRKPRGEKMKLGNVCQIRNDKRRTLTGDDE